MILEIIGTEGIITVPDFTSGDRDGRVILTRGKGDAPAAAVAEEIAVPNLYIEETAMFTDWILGGPEPELVGSNGLANQRIIDRALTT